MASPGPHSIANASTTTALGRGGVHQLSPVERMVMVSWVESELDAVDYARSACEMARSGQEVQRRAMASRRRAILYDNWRPLLIDDIKNRTTPELWQAILGAKGEYADISRNAAKHIWGEMSVLYNQAVRRTTQDSAEAQKYKSLMGELFHPFWQGVEFELQAFNDLIIYPTFKKRRGKWTATHHRVGPDSVSIIFDEELGLDEPYHVILIDHHDDKPSRYRYWSPAFRFVFDADLQRLDEVTGVPIDDEAGGWENPFGELPFEFVHRDPFHPAFFDQTSGDDLVDLTLKLGRFETDTDYKAWRAGHKQLIALGERIGKIDKALLDPSAIIKLTGQGVTATLIDWQIALKERIDVANSWEQRAAASRGINPERLRRTGYQTAEGARLSERGLDEGRERMQPIFQVAESGYFYLAAIVAARSGVPRDLIHDKTQSLEVAHQPISYPGDPVLRLDMIERKARMGIASLFDAVLDDHPEWGEDDVIDFVKANIEAMSELQDLKRRANIPEMDLGNRSAADEENGSMGTIARDGVPIDPPAAGE